MERRDKNSIMTQLRNRTGISFFLFSFFSFLFLGRSHLLFLLISRRADVYRKQTRVKLKPFFSFLFCICRFKCHWSLCSFLVIACNFKFLFIKRKNKICSLVYPIFFFFTLNWFLNIFQFEVYVKFVPSENALKVIVFCLANFVN